MLWAGLEQGHIDLVVTDHSPSPPELKCVESGRFDEAWGGIASIQLSLPVFWTAARARGLGLDSVARWMSDQPARLAGIRSRKGALEVGLDADLVVFDPETSWEVDAAELQHRHKLTPYAGSPLRGSLRSTYVRGRRVFDAGSPFAPPAGRPIFR